FGPWTNSECRGVWHSRPEACGGRRQERRRYLTPQAQGLTPRVPGRSPFGIRPLSSASRHMQSRSLLALLALSVACTDSTRQIPVAAPGDSAMKSLAAEIIQDLYRRHPSAATQLGVHA